MMLARAAATAFASLFLMSAAFAQTPAPAPAPAPAAKAAPAAKTEPAAKTATDAKAKPERTAASIECSNQADAKGLKGKERKKFRSQCKRDAAKAAK